MILKRGLGEKTKTSKQKKLFLRILYKYAE